MQFRPIIITLLLILLTNASFAQNDELPADSTIKKFKVKTLTVTSFYEPDTTIESYEEIWKYDTLGRITSQQLIDKDTSDNDDTGFDGEFYFYKGGKLMEDWKIGVWNTKTRKVDTIVRQYYYSDKNKLIKTISKGHEGEQNYTETYEYKNNYELKHWKDDRDGFHYTDSLVYLENGKLGFDFYRPNDCLYEYKYNRDNQIVRYRILNISDTNRLSTIKYYYYSNGLLIKETEINADPFETKKNIYFKQEGKYYYYGKNGLLKEARRLADNVIRERYSYEYYH